MRSMQNASAWYRQGNTWIFLPIPSVTVESVMTSRGPGWADCMHGRVMTGIRASRSSDRVKAAVWEFFDRRVEL